MVLPFLFLRGLTITAAQAGKPSTWSAGKLHFTWMYAQEIEGRPLTSFTRTTAAQAGKPESLKASFYRDVRRCSQMKAWGESLWPPS